MFRHREGCVFGGGAYRIELEGSMPRYCQSESELRVAMKMLGESRVLRVCRDGYCLDYVPEGDANTPDVVDAEHWLGLTQAEGMRVLGLSSETEYARAYRMVEAAVVRRENREGQTGVHASIVIKRPGAHVADA